MPLTPIGVLTPLSAEEIPSLPFSLALLGLLRVLSQVAKNLSTAFHSTGKLLGWVFLNCKCSRGDAMIYKSRGMRVRKSCESIPAHNPCAEQNDY